jgi:hypothetical protein
VHNWQVGVAASVVAGIGALGLAGLAVADRPQVHHTVLGQAAAKAVMIRRTDLGSAPGWTGGPKKPDNTPDPTCAGYDPKESDLVEIGEAESNWQNGAISFDSESSVMQTPAMVRLDWQRSILDPDLLPCLKKAFARELPKTAQIVSLRRIPVAALATYTRVFRVLIDVKSGTRKVRFFTDLVLLGRGRTEITLTTFAPFATVVDVQAAEVRLSVLLLSRIRM